MATSAFSTLSEILAMCRDTVKWFSPTDQRGMILFGPQVENSMCAFRYLCIGIDDDDCEEIIARFLESAGVAKEQIDAL